MPQKVRIEETQITDPQGSQEIRRTLVCVREVDQEALPEGAKVVEAEPHDWQEPV